MSPELRRPQTDEVQGHESQRGGRDNAWTLPQSIRDRRDAALRLAPYTSLWGLPGRDPWAPERVVAPSAFGLCRHELEAELARCHAAGWSGDELRERFVDPRTVAA